MKKYTDVIRYGKSTTNGVLKEGDIISITEKIDGANASFKKDINNSTGVSCYSRNTELTEENTLRGFYGFVLNHVVPIKDKLNPNYIYYGEWLCSHKVRYKEECYYKFYMFSIWDLEKHQYLSDDIVLSEAKRLNLKTIPYFYYGEFISYEHLQSFVGISDLTQEPNTGEGIVVKNINYFDTHNRQVFVKLVSEKFAEIQKQKLPKNPNVNQKEITLVKSVLTTARVEKLIHKLVDENILQEDFTIKDMGIILKNLGNRVYEDIMKEESDLFKEFEDSIIKRTIGKNLPSVVKQILEN